MGGSSPLRWALALSRGSAGCAVNNGVTREQIREIMIHAAPYCGIPAALDGLRNAGQVLDDLESAG